MCALNPFLSVRKAYNVGLASEELEFGGFPVILTYHVPALSEATACLPCLAKSELPATILQQNEAPVGNVGPGSPSQRVCL